MPRSEIAEYYSSTFAQLGRDLHEVLKLTILLGQHKRNFYCNRVSVAGVAIDLTADKASETREEPLRSHDHGKQRYLDPL